MKVARIIKFCLACMMLLTAAVAPAQTIDIRAQTAAATSAAGTSLRSDIYAARITPTLTVGQFIQQTDSEEAFAETLTRAQQIGGPRWIDDQTCQVRLELSGSRVTYALVSIAAVRSRVSPVSAADLETRLADWKTHTFTGTGTSISAQRVEGVRPFGANEAWAGVGEAARTQAVTAARQDAARNVLDSIRTVEISPGQTVGDVMSRQQAQEQMTNWLISRPVTQMRFREDLQVELTVSAPSEDLLETVLATARTVPGANVPDDPKSMDDLRREFARRVSGAIGRASAKNGAAASPQAIDLPAQPPGWINQLLEVEAVAPRVAASPLRTKSAAEAKATEALRARIGALQLSQGKTIDDAAQQDARISAAVNRALLNTRVFWVEYRPDGSVLVRMSIDPRGLWQDIRDNKDRP